MVERSHHQIPGGRHRKEHALPLPLIAESRSGYVTSDGVRIYYEDIGEGFPIVFQAGAGGTSRTWKDVGYAIGLEGFRRILIDHRGRGRSQKPVGTEAHLVERYVADVIAVLDALKIERTAFWGYSAGTWAGYGLATDHPHRMVALIASGGIGTLEDYGDPRNREAILGQARQVREQGRRLTPAAEEAEGVPFPPWLYEQRDAADPEMVALQLLGSAQWKGPWSLLPRITAPTLMLVGEREDPEETMLRAAAMLPGARRVVLSGLVDPHV